MAQILAATAKTVTQLDEYKNFKDDLSTENAGHLPLHEDHHHSINLVDGKHSFYGPIYSLFKNELSIFQAYIDKNPAYKFIRPSKSPTDASILFIPKFNGSF